ncbi:MDR family MFS transporter [Nocardioides sp. SYSU D00038]|uniref:MDR family MFS transporter n=1 Tax=Nocardioides sp. SYSU D00038 TaxID=2812554 RepID=UPI0027DD13D1|nr:MDR family MFS transporter [Nocardioides sp. SYSU D00038]
MTSAPAISRRDVGLRSERGPVLLAVMLSISLVAIDSTILAPAVPAVVDDLGGFSSFPWLFSAYLLAQAVTLPLYGKVADLVGRKPVILAGIVLFVVGSLLCGLAWNMGTLIAARVVQGLGAGAVQSTGMTVVGDIYSLEERAKVQAYLASVWAVSSLVGPTLGGLFSDHLSWRWIFLVNLPIGLVAAWLLRRGFHEEVQRRERSVDWLGAVLLAGGGTLLLLGLLEGGVRWAWSSPASIAVFATAAVLVAAFVLVERRAREPVLPLWLFRSRALNAAAAASFVVGVLLLGLTTYVPVYAQVVYGSSALAGGLALAAMTIGWPIAASTSGRIYLGLGFRATVTLGGVIALAGALLLTTVGADDSVWWLAVPCFVMGLGFGYAASPAVVVAQSSVAWQHRGVATGANLFARSVGSAVGVAAFGAVVNRAVADRLGDTSPDLEHLSPAVLDPAVHGVFVASAAIAVALVVAGLLMPRRVEAPAVTPVMAD